MKTLTKLFAAAWIAAFALVSTPSVSFPGSDAGIKILIKPRPVGHPTSPHSSVYNPFSAQLIGNSVVIFSDSDWGYATIILYSTCGDYYTASFDTVTGSVLIPCSGNAGDYYIIIVADNGLEFEGEFEIQ